MLRFNHRSGKLFGLFFFGALVALLLGCTPSHPMSTFQTFGPVADSQLNLFWIIFGVGAVVFIGVEGVIIYMAIRFRRRSQDEPDPEQVHGHTGLEVAWTAAPTLLLIAVAIPTIFTIFDNAQSPRPPEQGGLVVEAIGHQWWFEFKYPEFDLVTANEMHIPVGEPINLVLRSVDVIHSFWVPKLAGKVDMIPNILTADDNTMWMQADEPGVYFGQCAEFCGVSHANMRFRVVAHPRDEFDAWVVAQRAESVQPVDALVQQGQDIFLNTREAGCNACHTVRGTKASGTIGPDLTHLASRMHMAAGILDNTDESGKPNVAFLQANLREWLEDPDEVKPGNLMSKQAPVYTDPNKKLTDQEITALIAYLSSLN